MVRGIYNSYLQNDTFNPFIDNSLNRVPLGVSGTSKFSLMVFILSNTSIFYAYCDLLLISSSSDSKLTSHSSISSFVYNGLDKVIDS